MSGRIKGITVEIGGETTGLQNAIKDVEKRSNNLAKELKDVDKLLKFNPGNVELLAQKQQLLTGRIAATAEKLDALKAAQAQVEAQFQSGQIGVEQYRAFQRELVTTEGSLNGLRSQLQRMTDEQNRVVDSTKQLGTLFQATGTDIDQFADALGSGLTNAIRKGTATSQQLEQAIDQIGQAALGADVDLNRMRDALRNVDNGASIDQVRKDLNNVAKEAGEAESAVKNFGGELSSVVGGIVAGGGLAGVVKTALDTSSLDTKIDITFEVPEESKESVRQAIKGVQVYGVDAEEALEGVRRQWALNKDASDESNETIVKGAATIAAAYSQIDFTELIQETNEIGAALGISNEEALGLVNSLLKTGFPPEQLDIIAEYGEQLSIAGYSAEEIQNIFAAGVETKTWNIDNLMDGLKEAKIGLSEFGLEIPKATKELLSMTNISESQLKEWGAAVAEGGEAGSQAMFEVTKALSEVEDATLRNELGVQLFGTKWEDQGSKIVDTLLNAENGTANLGENITQLADDTARLDSDPAVKLQEALNNMMTALQPLLTSVAELVTKFATWAAENPILLAAIAAITTVLGVLMGIFAALAPVVSLIITHFGAIKAVFLALTGPVGIVIAIITALIAIGVALYKNWDEVKAYASKTWESIKNTLSAVWIAIKAMASIIWDGIKAYFTTVLNVYKTLFTTIWNAIKAVLTTVWNGIKSTATSVFEGIKNTITTVFNTVRSTITSVWNAIKSTVQTAVNSIWNSVKNAFNNLLNSIRSTMNNVKSTITNIWNSVMSYLKGINLFSIGTDMIRGLIKGIKGMTKEAIGAITGVVDGVVSKAKSLLKIKSPSRVFMEIGEFTNEGFIKGIEQTSNQLAESVDNVYGSLAYNANRAISMPKSTGNVNRTESATKEQPSLEQKQPFLIQLVLEDGRAIAETLVDDITSLQSFKTDRIAKFR